MPIRSIPIYLLLYFFALRIISHSVELLRYCWHENLVLLYPIIHMFPINLFLSFRLFLLSIFSFLFVCSVLFQYIKYCAVLMYMFSSLFNVLSLPFKKWTKIPYSQTHNKNLKQVKISFRFCNKVFLYFIFVEAWAFILICRLDEYEYPKNKVRTVDKKLTTFHTKCHFAADN